MSAVDPFAYLTRGAVDVVTPDALKAKLALGRLADSVPARFDLLLMAACNQNVRERESEAHFRRQRRGRGRPRPERPQGFGPLAPNPVRRP